ncbi:hypothetical protein [Nocardia wallacei]|uniref:hypothetical protein n=1 Tax=Nocardia wallacei TaxID=480035 RepID=UPI002458808F|nr:hypothetical protein [Nocardia wallacei]
MTKPQRDPIVDRLRHDVDDLYEMNDDTNRTAHTSLAAVRGVDLRLRRFQRTSGRQFGILIATLRQHSRRFDQTDARLDGMDRRFDKMDTRLDKMGTRFDKVDERFDQGEAWSGGADQRLDNIEGYLRQMQHTLTEVVTLLRK